MSALFLRRELSAGHACMNGCGSCWGVPKGAETASSFENVAYMPGSMYAPSPADMMSDLWSRDAHWLSSSVKATDCTV